jgi:hypothetical protein
MTADYTASRCEAARSGAQTGTPVAHGECQVRCAYNDGINQIRVMAQYADDAVAGIDQLLAIAPPDDLERLAVAFASFYLHAWQ